MISQKTNVYLQENGNPETVTQLLKVSFTAAEEWFEQVKKTEMNNRPIIYDYQLKK